MARKVTTTTPTNKTGGSKPGSKKPRKDSSLSLVESTEPEEKPLQATIGEVLVAKGAKPVNEVQVENFTRRLPCPLTDTELIEKSRRASDIRRQVRHESKTVDAAKTEFDRIKKESESKCKAWDAELETLDDSINANQEYRDVACQRVFDLSHGAGEYREVRLDTRALLQQPRAMNQREIDNCFSGKLSAQLPEDDLQRFAQDPLGALYDALAEDDDSDEEVDFD